VFLRVVCCYDTAADVHVTLTHYRGEVKRIALAGGIGAGKSTVVEYLRSLGYVAIDADEIYRDLTRRGEPLLDVLVDAFGTAVLTPEDELDRAFVASVVFRDDSALRRLNDITHPWVGREIRRQLDTATGAAAFVAIPLFRGEHRVQLDLDEVWSIQVTPNIALERLTEQRAMTHDAALARLNAQPSNDEREAIVDEVIWNNSTRDALRGRVDELLRERGIDGH
jgi:dephospho-CoA kinase